MHTRGAIFDKAKIGQTFYCLTARCDMAIRRCISALTVLTIGIGACNNLPSEGLFANNGFFPAGGLNNPFLLQGTALNGFGRPTVLNTGTNSALTPIPLTTTAPVATNGVSPILTPPWAALERRARSRRSTA